LADIDLNMVRAGVVPHPAHWSHGGYAEIRRPPARYGISDLEARRVLFGVASLVELQEARQHWIEESLRSEGAREATTRTPSNMAV